MNQNPENEQQADGQNEAQNEEANAEQQEAAKATTPLTPAGAATDLGPKRLNSYEQWQQQNQHLLMDGTYSQQSYIVLSQAFGIQFGIQPRLMPHGNHIHFTGLIRAAHVIRASNDNPEKMDGLNAEEKEAKIQALLDYFDGPTSWKKRSHRRISRHFDLKIPIAPNKAGSLEEFVALVEGPFFQKLIDWLPKPANGWDAEQLDKAKDALLSYFQIVANQFGLFNVITTEEKKWDGTVVAADALSDDVVGFLDALEPDPVTAAAAASMKGATDLASEGDDD